MDGKPKDIESSEYLNETQLEEKGGKIKGGKKQYAKDKGGKILSKNNSLTNSKDMKGSDLHISERNLHFQK